jgi:hypothetical protein
MKKIYLIAISILVSASAWAQTTLINPATGGGFEAGATFAANGWTVVNNGGGAANKWQVGTAAFFAGTNGAYISNNGGTTNTYSNTDARVQHFYQDIVFPAGEPYITLSFRWKGVMESCCDYMRVHLVPTSTTPTAGTLIGTGQISPLLNSQSTWQTATYTLPCSAAGTTQRLVFTFRCDGSLGSNPVIATDNISLVSTSVPPTCASLLGTGVVNIASLPYTIASQTTCGQINDLTSTNSVVCGSTNYYTGEDVVYSFTPTTSGQITISIQ